MHHSILVELARALSPDEFAQRLPDPVLVVMSEIIPDQASAEDDTQVGEEVLSGTPTENRGFPTRFETLAVRKKRLAGEREMVTLGRERGNDIVVRTPGVSKTHAGFLLGEPLRVLDRGSQNGTFVDGERLAKGQTVEVRPGQELVFGDLVTRLLSPAELYSVLKTHVT